MPTRACSRIEKTTPSDGAPVGEYPLPLGEYPLVAILHGAKDRTNNVRCSINLYRHLQATGHESYLYLLRGAFHGDPEF